MLVLQNMAIIDLLCLQLLPIPFLSKEGFLSALLPKTARHGKLAHGQIWLGSLYFFLML